MATRVLFLSVIDLQKGRDKRMTEEQMKQRKEMLKALMEEPSFVPMKLKELAVLLDIPRDQRAMPRALDL